MVAASPVRHDPPINMMPVAVQQYQVQWSTLMSDTMAGSSYGPLQSTTLHKASAAAAAVFKEAPKCHPSSRMVGASMSAPAAAAAAFKKLLRTFGDLSEEDEDDSVVSVDEPCRVTTTSQSFIGGPSVALKNCRQPCLPYILSAFNQIR